MARPAPPLVAVRGDAAGARRRFALGDRALGYLLLAPTAALILLLVGYPFARALWLSFHKKLLGQIDAPWIGLANYEALLRDPRFWGALKNTLVFVGGSVALKLAIGLLVALILNEALPLRNLWRSIVLLPYALPSLVAVLIWRWMYNDTGGVLSYLLTKTHIADSPILWLANPGTAMGAVIAVNVWKGFPFFAITLLAGLQAVPQDQYDAAKVDGAGIMARFRYVTLPGLLPSIAVVCVFSIILTLNDFAIIWLLTRGGPGGATEVIATLTYAIAIPGYELGKGVAASVLLLPLLVLLVVLLGRFINRREEEL